MTTSETPAATIEKDSATRDLSLSYQLRELQRNWLRTLHEDIKPGITDPDIRKLFFRMADARWVANLVWQTSLAELQITAEGEKVSVTVPYADDECLQLMDYRHHLAETLGSLFFHRIGLILLLEALESQKLESPDKLLQVTAMLQTNTDICEAVLQNHDVTRASLWAMVRETIAMLVYQEQYLIKLHTTDKKLVSTCGLISDRLTQIFSKIAAADSRIIATMNVALCPDNVHNLNTMCKITVDWCFRLTKLVEISGLSCSDQASLQLNNAYEALKNYYQDNKKELTVEQCVDKSLQLKLLSLVLYQSAMAAIDPAVTDMNPELPIGIRDQKVSVARVFFMMAYENIYIRRPELLIRTIPLA